MQEKMGVPDVSIGLHIVKNTVGLVFNASDPFVVQLCNQNPVPRQTPSLMYMPLHSIRISNYSTKL